MSFNENLKVIRNGIGMTQKSLGDKIGVTSVTIGNWERGVKQPSFDLLPKLADILEISVDDLIGNTKKVHIEHLFPKVTGEEELILKYRQLDEHGRKLISLICDAELERCRITPNVMPLDNERHRKAHAKKHNRYIPLYSTPPAAGIAVPLEGSEFEMILADDSVPADADYAVYISGDSMEPIIKDGEMVFVKETEDLVNGDVGIFCVNGAMYCKQYYVDVRRNLHLLSANPNRIGTNIYADVESSLSVKCCGKVLLKHTVPLPDYFEGNK